MRQTGPDVQSALVFGPSFGIFPAKKRNRDFPGTGMHSIVEELHALWQVRRKTENRV